MQEDNREFESENEALLNNNKEVDVFFTKTEAKEIVKSSLPIFASTIINSTTNFALPFILARLGKNELAAGGLVISTQLIIQGFLFSPLYAVGVISGNAVGQHESEQNENVLQREEDKTITLRNIDKVSMPHQQGLLLGALLSVPYCILSMYSGKLYIAMGNDVVIANLNQAFFNSYIWGAWADVLSNASTQHAIALKRQNAVLLITTLQKAVTIGVGSVLTLGLLNAPKLDMAGLGYAYAGAAILNLLGTNLYMIYKGDLGWRDYLLLNKIKKRIATFKDILSIGTGIGLQVGLETASLAALVFLAGRINEDQLVATEVSMQYGGLVIVPLIGATQAMSILIGEAIGKKNPRQAKRYVNASVLLGLTIPIAAGILLSTLSHSLTSVFVDDNIANADKIFEISKYLLYITAGSLVPEFLKNVAIGALRGLQDTFIPMIVNGGLSIAGVGAGYVAASNLSLDSYGLFLARLMSFFLIGIPLGVRWISKINTIVNESENIHKSKDYEYNNLIADDYEHQNLDDAEEEINTNNYKENLRSATIGLVSRGIFSRKEKNFILSDEEDSANYNTPKRSMCGIM